MTLRNTRAKWGAISQSFHWLVALFVFAMFGMGWIMADMPFSPDKFRLYSWHKSLGMIILALVALRLSWRILNTTPDLPNHMNRFEKFGAHAAHWALYALMIAMPLTGWLMSSTGGLTVNVFGWVEIPDLVAVDTDLSATLKRVHYWLSWAFAALIVGHFSAALYHHFVHRDNVLTSMLPSFKRKRS